MLIVTKPGGLDWSGVHYPYGAQLPAGAEKHPNLKTLLSVNFVAFADSPLISSDLMPVSEQKAPQEALIIPPRRRRGRPRKEKTE